MERLVRNTLVEHMVNNNLFAAEQHGFIAGKSCTTQLLEYMEDITQAIDNGEDIDVIYLDFRKAFDRVPHTRLLYKLHRYGVRVQSFRLDQRISYKQNTKGNCQWSGVQHARSHQRYSPR